MIGTYLFCGSFTVDVNSSERFGTYSVSEAVSAGLDLEMPGPSRFRGEVLAHAISANKISESTLDGRVRAVLNLVKEAAKSGIPEKGVEKLLDRPADRALLRRAATESVVLLKNEGGVLPLNKSKPIAVIGPNARDAAYRGGKSAHLRPYYVVSPLQGIMAQSKSEVRFSQGVYNYKGLPLLSDWMWNARGEPGFDLRVFNDPPGTPNRECIDHFEFTISNGFFMHYENPKRRSKVWYINISGTLTPEESGDFDFGLTVQGTANLYLDGELVIDNTTRQKPGSSFFGTGTIEETTTVKLTGGKTYKILCLWGSPPTSQLAQTRDSPFAPGGVTLSGCRRVNVEESIAAAVKLAKEIEQVVVCVGLTGSWESERDDREYLDLPPHSDELVSRILAVNPKAVVCLQSGSPVSMPWLASVDAIF